MSHELWVNCSSDVGVAYVTHDVRCVRYNALDNELSEM